MWEEEGPRSPKNGPKGGFGDFDKNFIHSYWCYSSNSLIIFQEIMTMILTIDVHFFLLNMTMLMVLLLPEKTTYLRKIWFFSTRPKILSVSQIALFFNTEYLQNGLIVWLHILYGDNVVTSDAAGERTFAMTDTELCVPVITVSTQDNSMLLQQSKSGFHRTINWNRY